MSRLIRLAEPRDAAALAAIYAPSVTDSPASFEEIAPDAAEMARRLAANLAFAPWLVLEDDAAAEYSHALEGAGHVVGYAYASRHRERAAYQWSVDVTVYVRADQHRRGVGRALYQLLLDLLRAQGFHAAHAGITLPNASSVGLHESLGFRPVALYPAVGYKRGAWHDVGWWQLELSPRPASPPPSPPLPFDPVGVAAFLASLPHAHTLGSDRAR
jgi:phosphinothricin acetyltransferase